MEGFPASHVQIKFVDVPPFLDAFSRHLFCGMSTHGTGCAFIFRSIIRIATYRYNNKLFNGPSSVCITFQVDDADAAFYI